MYVSRRVGLYLYTAHSAYFTSSLWGTISSSNWIPAFSFNFVRYRRSECLRVTYLFIFLKMGGPFASRIGGARCRPFFLSLFPPAPPKFFSKKKESGGGGLCRFPPSPPPLLYRSGGGAGWGKDCTSEYSGIKIRRGRQGLLCSPKAA